MMPQLVVRVMWHGCRKPGSLLCCVDSYVTVHNSTDSWCDLPVSSSRVANSLVLCCSLLELVRPLEALCDRLL
jgi:hypothetical protein